MTRRNAIIATSWMLAATLATHAFAQETAAPVAVPAIPGEVENPLADCAALESGNADALATASKLIEHGFSCVDSLRNGADAVKAALRDTLESPETQSRLLNSFLERDHGWQFLKDVNFKVKTFEAQSTGEAALGFSYDYRKSLQNHDLPCSRTACTRGLDLELAANGNVAAEADRNPNNLLETSLSFAFFQSTGGVSRATTADERHRLDQMFRAIAEAEPGSDAQEKVIEGIESLVRPLLSDQFYWEVAGNAALESDQKFDRKQWTYGVRAIFEVKAWNDASALAKFNLLDYPFAAMRALTGYEDDCHGGAGCFKPRGTAWPSILVGLDRVQAADDAPRSLAGATDDYDRLRLEASFRTPVARYGDDALYVSVAWRYYKELGASAAVRTAGLDSFRYFTVALGGNEGVYVSYTDGRLPFDFVNDKVYELGWQFQR